MKSVFYLFFVQNEALLEAICAMEGLPQKYNFSHCCSKVDFERRVFRNKKADVGFLPPLPTLDSEEKCQAYKNNRIFSKKVSLILVEQ